MKDGSLPSLQDVGLMCGFYASGASDTVIGGIVSILFSSFLGSF